MPRRCHTASRPAINRYSPMRESAAARCGLESPKAKNACSIPIARMRWHQSRNKALQHKQDWPSNTACFVRSLLGHLVRVAVWVVSEAEGCLGCTSKAVSVDTAVHRAASVAIGWRSFVDAISGCAYVITRHLCACAVTSATVAHLLPTILYKAYCTSYNSGLRAG